ncbi:MAG: YjfB family protein [Lachnospiraceae bacterium]|nr:YjfB family protein [Lachnospiraceae bacterium]
MDGISPISSSLVTSLKGVAAPSKVNVAMLSKALDTQKKAGSEMVKMMEQSVNPAVGSNFDVSA